MKSELNEKKYEIIYGITTYLKLRDHPFILPVASMLNFKSPDSVIGHMLDAAQSHDYVPKHGRSAFIGRPVDGTLPVAIL